MDKRTNNNNKFILFLGAGFSKTAGLPLTNELFDKLPWSPIPGYKDIYINVKREWDNFHNLNPNIYVEEWIRNIYNNRVTKDGNKRDFWDDVRDFFLARLVDLPHGKNSHYYFGITTEIKSKIHKNFWEKMLNKYDIRNIITTNYDLVIEQGLKREYTGHRSAPLCFYAGHPFGLKVKKNINVSKRKYEEVELGHEICLFKLHGSLNWVDEPHAYKVHDDVRAVFRKNQMLGRPRVIPPLIEKEKPEWAFDIWNRAERVLKNANTWFFCGYSCPEYDYAISNLLKKSYHQNLRIKISDINSEVVLSRLTNILPGNFDYELLNGLPELLNQI